MLPRRRAPLRGLRYRDQRAHRHHLWVRHPAGLGGEPTRVWQKIDAIRAKQASKPKHSPLPQTETTFSALASAMMKFAPDLAEELVKWFREAQREQEAGLEEFLKVLRASPRRD